MAHDHEHDHAHAHPGLDIQVERPETCRARVSMSVPAAEFEKSYSLGLKNVSQRTRIKGFRPGKTPRSFVEKHYGAEVQREVLQHFLEHALQEAIEEHELRPAANPRIDTDSIEVAKGQDVKVEFDLFLRPEVELKDYKGLTIQGQSVEISDEEITQAIEELRRANSRPEPAGDEGLGEEGMAVATLAFHAEGQDEPKFTREGLRIAPHAPPAGVDPEAFKAALTGAKQGETKDVELTFPEDFPEPELAGKPGKVAITLNEVYRIEAPTDEELHKLLEVEDDAAMRAKAREQMTEAKQRNEEQRIEHELLERLLGDHPLELPDALVQEQVERKVEEARPMLESQGLEGDALEQRLNEERANAAESTTKAMRAVYLMEEIAKREELKIETADVQAELEQIAQRNQATVEEVRKYYQEQGLFQNLGLELLERKVRSFLRESADIQ